MSIIEILLPISILLAGSFALAFILAVRSGQYDDVETPARRILFDAPKSQNESEVTGDPS
ncbi:MAG: cbb3-type cytochrome oxidase assembly protein CcoS [Deltaproteobacteria bacterium]|jgi:cbb3-type cytochrome oxidase maturation protein|nr:cbb3-type cytochrome oxidase assembly protein CcoS [Deltaproteobacteria bacterium]